MTGEIIAISTTNPDVIEETSVKDLELQAGYSANICYTNKQWSQIVKEDYDKTERRILGNKKNHHHSVFGHGHVSIYFTGMPKLLAMLLNNENEYNASEKSARYTEMKPTEREFALYEKWTSILEEKIKSVCPSNKFLDDKKIHKLAMENARYMISVMTPTQMEYTTSFRQWNYLYDFASQMLEEKTSNRVIQMLKPSLEEFIDVLDQTGIITHDIHDYHHRDFSLIVDDNDYIENFGRSYSTNYKATSACVAQQQRHRSLNFNAVFPTIDEFFIPPILEGDTKLEALWLKDIASVAELVPQGKLLMVNETGTYENFALKLEERLCTNVQLETCLQNYKTLLKYVRALRESEDLRNLKILDKLEPYTKGARCLSGYICTNPCCFQDGIHLTRKI